MIVHVVTQALQNVFPREPEILHFTKYLLIELKVVVVLVKERSGLILQLLRTDQVLVADVVL